MSPEVSRRAAVLGTTTWSEVTNRSRPGPIVRNPPALLTPVGPNAALVVWKQEQLNQRANEGSWTELRDVFDTNRDRLDIARNAAISGPIRFEPIGSQRPNPIIPYLADLRMWTTTFAVQTVLDLHEGDVPSAWTNLLAVTSLVTAYDPEPIDISHLVRFACAAVAYNTTWNSLQFHGWSDAQLAELQRRWEAVDFFSGLPQTAAYSRANMTATYELERQRSLSPGINLQELIRSPRSAWSEWISHWRRFRFLTGGSYEEEKAILLYYRDRELELRRAVRCTTWSEMRQLPGATNIVPFTSPLGYPTSSGIVGLMNSRQLMMGWQSKGRGLLGRAAETEARRRLIVAVLGLERYRGRHGSYPKALNQLVPELLASVPLDFIDGQALRYRLTDDSHFILYSVGLDCVDDGGEMRRDRHATSLDEDDPNTFGSQHGTDLVWPRPASAAEAEFLRQERIRAEVEQKESLEDMQANEEWTRSANRQAKLSSILAQGLQPLTNEATYRGHPLSLVLRNEQAAGSKKMALADMLTLKQITTGAEPEIATFELSISFDALSNIGSLHLYIDPSADEDSDEGCNVAELECARATNGNCLLIWDTIYEAPGKHALQAGLSLEGNSDEDISGPLLPFHVQNLCQFSQSSASFEPEHGPTFRARFPEPNASYVLQLKSPTGEPLKTLTGNTTNGIMKVHWDLIDDHGVVRTNQSLDSVLYISLPDSARSQTLKGP